MRGITEESRRKLRALFERATGRLAPRQNSLGGVSRRDFLHLSAAAGAAASVGTGVAAQEAAAHDEQSSSAPDDFNEATIAQLQRAMARGRTSAVELTNFYRAESRLSTNGGHA